MAERKSVYTDFKDPFHLLNELRNVGLERVYKNSFAYGNRDDMSMGYSGQPSSQVGPTSRAQVRLDVNAPSRTFDRSVGSGSYKPNIRPYNVNLNYSRPDDGKTPELDRVGSVARPLLAIGAQYYRNIQNIRTQEREKAEAEALEEASDIAGAPAMQKIENLNRMGTQLEAKQRANQGREDFLQRRAAAKQASNAEAMARTQETLGPQASAVLRPRGPRTAWDMLAQPAPPNVTATMRSINQPPSTLPPPTGMPGAPGAPMTSAGSQAPLTPGQMGTNTATLLTASTKASRPGRKKLPPPPPPQPPTMAPPSASQLPPPPMGKATKGTKGAKGAAKGSKTTKPPTSS